MKRIWPWMRKSLLLVASLAVLLVLVAWLSGFFVPKITPGSAGTAARGTAETLPPGTQTATVEVRQAEQVVQALGTIRATHEFTIGSRLMARVAAVHVAAGQAVEAGQILVELDEADLQARIAQARAAVEAAAARLRQAESDLEKIEQLQAQGAATARELEDRRRAADVASADLAAAQQAQAEAQAQLEYATIRSPIAGVVIEKLIEQGDMAQPGRDLIKLYDPNRLQLVAPVPESTAVKLKVGDSVNVRVDALDKQCAATISEIVPQATPGSRSFEVKVTGPCPPGVYSGMFGRMMIPQGTREQLVIPAGAVRQVGQLEIVQVVEAVPAPAPGSAGAPQQVVARYVTTGQRIGDSVEVLSGLEAGEEVALYP